MVHRSICTINVFFFEVGYAIRFENVSDKDRTTIKYKTDGRFFRETMLDPLRSKYWVIMLNIQVLR